MPRILYVTPFWPDGPSIGARVRSNHILRALREIGPVEIVVLDDEKVGNAAISESGRNGAVSYGIDVQRRPNSGLLKKLRWTIDSRSPFPNGCSVACEAVQRVVDSFEGSDLVWFFKLRSPDMFPPMLWSRSVVDIDDVPSTYERARLRTARGPVERLQVRRNLFAWTRRERLLGERFTVLSVCSEEDRQYLQSMGVTTKIHVIPNGFEKPRVEPVRNCAIPSRIGFIGLFDYYPNVEGLQWFVTECWPRLKREVPDLRLRLVGPGSDGPAKPLAPDIDGLGWISDPAIEIQTWSAMIVPIRIGAGTRVKIAQAFSQKCPIVSTALGAFGYSPVNGHDMYIADSAEAFCDACINVIREPEEAAQVAERAWSKFLEKWTWEAITPLIWATAEDGLRLKADR